MINSPKNFTHDLVPHSKTLCSSHPHFNNHLLSLLPLHLSGLNLLASLLSQRPPQPEKRTPTNLHHLRIQTHLTHHFHYRYFWRYRPSALTPQDLLHFSSRQRILATLVHSQLSRPSCQCFSLPQRKVSDFNFGINHREFHTWIFWTGFLGWPITLPKNRKFRH